MSTMRSMGDDAHFLLTDECDFLELYLVQDGQKTRLCEEATELSGEGVNVELVRNGQEHFRWVAGCLASFHGRELKFELSPEMAERLGLRAPMERG